VRRLLAVAFAIVVAGSGLVPAPVEAAVPGGVTWTVDHRAKTITAHVQIQIYSGCSGNPYGEEDEKAVACRGVTSQVTQFLADKIKRQSEGVWNRGYFYRCYRFILSVDVKLASDPDKVDGDRIGVMIDPTFAGIRDHVSNSTGDSSDWASNDPSASMTPEQHGSAWGEQSQLSATTYAHEVGHILGLDDAYHDEIIDGEKVSVPNQGAPIDLMSDGLATNIDQSTINRVVERNRNNLKDKAGKAVSLDDLECPEFMATIAGKQTDHKGILFKYTSAAPCGGGTVSRSEEQVVDFISDEVHVDAVKLAEPSPLWPGLEVLLVPHGGQASQVNLAAGPFDEPDLFSTPVTFNVDRRNVKPGAAPMPPILDMGDVPCAGGEPGGGGQRDDCGRRSYTATLVVTLTGITVVFPQVEGSGNPDADTLYLRCPGPRPIPGQFTGENAAPRYGGTVPVAQLLDPDVDQITISGSATYSASFTGSLQETQYDWTIILCRIRKGVPAC